MESLNAAKNISTWKLNGITVVWTPSLPTHWIVTPRNGPPTSAAAWTLDSTTQFLKSDPSMACLSPNQKGIHFSFGVNTFLLLSWTCGFRFDLEFVQRSGHVVETLQACMR